MSVCETCNKNKKEVIFEDRKTNKSMCWSCAFKLKKNNYGTLNAIKAIIKLRWFNILRNIEDNIHTIFAIILGIYVAVCILHNVINFDILNLSMVALLIVFIKDEL